MKRLTLIEILVRLFLLLLFLRRTVYQCQHSAAQGTYPVSNAALNLSLQIMICVYGTSTSSNFQVNGIALWRHTVQIFRLSVQFLAHCARC